MEEKKKIMVWYCLRWPGLVCLCSLVFLFGLHINMQESVTVSSTADGKRIPVCSVQTDEKKVALTFDAAGEKEDTQKILAVLASHQVQAAFFVTGEWADTYPDEIKQIAANGHDIGSGGEGRKSMDKLTEKEIREELAAVHEKIETLTGIQMNLFRPPYRNYSNTLIEAAEKSGYLTVMWNVDSEDWKDYGTDSVIQSVMHSADLENGSIIRMHCGARYTAEALEAIINGLQDQGYEIVPVSQLAVWKNYHTDTAGHQIAD